MSHRRREGTKETNDTGTSSAKEIRRFAEQGEAALMVLEEVEQFFREHSQLEAIPTMELQRLRTRFHALVAGIKTDRTIDAFTKATHHKIFEESIQWMNPRQEMEQCRDAFLALHHLHRNNAPNEEIDQAELRLNVALFPFFRMGDRGLADKKLLKQGIAIAKQCIALMKEGGRCRERAESDLYKMELKLKNIKEKISS